MDKINLFAETNLLDKHLIIARKELADAYSQIETLTTKLREVTHQLEIAQNNLKDIR